MNRVSSGLCLDSNANQKAATKNHKAGPNQNKARGRAKKRAAAEGRKSISMARQAAACTFEITSSCTVCARSPIGVSQRARPRPEPGSRPGRGGGGVHLHADLGHRDLGIPNGQFGNGIENEYMLEHAQHEFAYLM